MELIIAKPVKKIKSVYNVRVKYMHGDGDAYTYSNTLYPNTEELKVVLDLLLDAKTVHPEKYFELVEQRGLEWDEWCDFFETDSTTIDGYADIKEVSVTYFDENSIEYDVDVKR